MTACFWRQQHLNMHPSHLRHATNPGWNGAHAITVDGLEPRRRKLLCPYDAINTVSGVYSSNGNPCRPCSISISFYFFNGFPFFRLSSPYFKPPSISPGTLSTLLFSDASPRGAVVGSQGHAAGFNLPVRESYRRFKLASI